jgi:SET domain-containing protein
VKSRPFRVGRSHTGLGLFATQPIDKGAFIVAYRGRRIATALAQTRERTTGAKYMFEIDARWTIDGGSRRNLARYVNHSCRPNAECVLRKGRLVFVARRAIKPEEEITLDYGRDYLELFIPECRCVACAIRSEVRRSKRKSARKMPRA